VLWESVEELDELLQARRVNSVLIKKQLQLIKTTAALAASQQEMDKMEAAFMEADLEARAPCS
jgi:hypothetical protein